MRKLFIFLIVTGLLLMPLKAETVTIIFFHTPGCEHCAQVDQWLQELKAEYKDDITIRYVDATTREGYDELVKSGFLITPAVKINETRLEYKKITKESLKNAIDEALKGETSSSGTIKLSALIIGILSGTTACVLAVAAFMFAMVTNPASRFRSILLIAVCFGLGLITVFMAMAVILAVGSYSLSGGGASTVRFYVSLALGYLVLVLGLNQFNYAFEVVKLPVSTKRFFERMLEALLSKKGLIGAFLFGILFAPVKLPCALPALGIVMERILVKGDIVEGLVLAAIYGVGVMIPIITVAVISGGSAQFASKLRWSDTYRKVSWGIGGIVVLAVAVWIFWNTFKIPDPVTVNHYTALVLFGVATLVILVLFVKYGEHVTKSKLWKKMSRGLQKIVR